MKEWSTLRKLMYLKGATGVPISEYTATGNPLSFDTNVAKPLASLLVPFTPTQSGTGDPYPPGGGKNLLDPATLEQGGIAEDGTDTVNSRRVRTGYMPVEAGKKYTISATGLTCFMHFYDANKGNIAENKGSTNITAPEGSAYARCFFRNSDSTDIVPFDVTNAQFEQSASATSYQPYSNIRPIDGTSAVNVWRTGKNLFDSTFVSGNVDASSGSITKYDYTTNRIISGFIELMPGKYSISCKEGKQSTIYFYESADTSTYVYAERLGSWTNNPRSFTLTNKRCAVIVLRNSDNSNITASDVTEFQLEVGETASEYSPYTGQTYNIIFPALGKNLLNVNATNTDNGYVSGFFLNENGGTTSNVSWAISEYTPIDSDETYCINNPSGGINPSISFYDGTKTYISSQKYNGTNPVRFTTPSNTKFIRVSFRPEYHNIQLEKGESATPYEPYTNTVYGGSLDLITGVLTATHRLVTLTGNEGFVFTTYSTSLYVNDPIFSDSKSGSTFTGWCSMSTTIDGKVSNYIYKAYSDHGLQFRYVDTYWGLSEVTSNAMNAKLQEWYEAGTPLQVCYLLSEPITYQLTPQQITALLGDNIIWSGTNGSNTAVYLKKG